MSGYRVFVVDNVQTVDAEELKAAATAALFSTSARKFRPYIITRVTRNHTF